MNGLILGIVLSIKFYKDVSGCVYLDYTTIDSLEIIMYPFKVEEWICVHKQPPENIFQNQHTGKLSQEYLFDMDSRFSLELLETLPKEPHMVDILHYEKFTHYDPLTYCFSHYKVRVFAEFIQVRLNEIQCIPKQFLFRLLHQALLGFQAVFRSLRPVKATGHNIGFNKKSQLRIDAFLNALSQRLDQTQIQEEDVVASVFEVYKNHFNQQITLPPLMNFSEAIHFLRYRAGISGQPREKLQVNRLPRRNINSEIFQPSGRVRSQSIDSVYEESKNTYLRMQNQGVVTTNPRQTTQPARTQPKKQTINSVVRMNIQEARTTQNTLSIVGDMVQFNTYRVFSQLLDNKKPPFMRLELVERLLRDPQHDEITRRIINVYKYAILEDPLMYSELQKVGGKFQEIENPIVSARISGIIAGNRKYEELTIRIPNLVFSHNRHPTEGSSPCRHVPQAKTDRENRIKQIITREKIKVSQAYSSGIESASSATHRFGQEEFVPRNHQRMQQLNDFKEEASKILFQF